MLGYCNHSNKCLGCGIGIIGGSFLCCRCAALYPGVVEQAIKDAKREQRIEELRIQRELKIYQRRKSFRSL